MVSHNVSTAISFPCLNRYAKSCVSNQFVGYLKKDICCLMNCFCLFVCLLFSVPFEAILHIQRLHYCREGLWLAQGSLSCNICPSDFAVSYKGPPQFSRLLQQAKGMRTYTNPDEPDHSFSQPMTFFQHPPPPKLLTDCTYSSFDRSHMTGCVVHYPVSPSRTNTRRAKEKEGCGWLIKQSYRIIY